MPRIRKLQPGGPSSKLAECFKLLLSGASGECLAGELGCCGDSCCSSTIVSRALSEYCQHSDAAREAFVSARGLDAMQAALARGSPSAAVAAARVLGALCTSPHGLRCVLRWQSAAGGDLLSQLAVAVGGSGAEGLPPELRTECVDALRAALGALYGPAAGGGLELAGALQVNACGSIGARPGDFLTRVALPPLLSPNAHLRAAAARLIATAVEEGALARDGGGGEGSAAATAAMATTLSAALGIAGPATVGGDGVDGPGAGSGAVGAAIPGGRGSPPRGLRVLALCELVAALLDSHSGSELLEAIRGPSMVLELAQAAVVESNGGGGGGDEFGSEEREALLDAVLLCVRQGPHKLWAVGRGEGCQRKRRAFAAGAAELATLLLSRPSAATVHSAGGCRGGEGDGAALARRGAAGLRITTAAALTSALAAWPQEVLHHGDLQGALSGLGVGLSGAVASALRACDGGAEAAAENVQQPAAMGGSDTESSGWREVPPWPTHFGRGFGGGRHVGGLGATDGEDCNTAFHDAGTLHAAAAAAAAAIRLFGAAGGAAAAADESPDRHGRAAPVSKTAAMAAARCLAGLLEAARNCRTATALLTSPLEAVMKLEDEPLEVFLTASTASTAATAVCRTGTAAVSGSLSCPMLARAAARLAEGLLTQPTGGGAAAAMGAALPGGWSHARAWRAGGGAGCGWGSTGGGGQQQRSTEQHTALVAALRVWSRLMAARRCCTCGGGERGRAPASAEDGIPGCEACTVRPAGPLKAVLESVEGLLPAQEAQPGGDKEHGHEEGLGLLPNAGKMEAPAGHDTQGATPYDSSDTDRAAELADADAILDECLVCLDAGKAV